MQRKQEYIIMSYIRPSTPTSKMNTTSKKCEKKSKKKHKCKKMQKKKSAKFRYFDFVIERDFQEIISREKSNSMTNNDQSPEALNKITDEQFKAIVKNVVDSLDKDLKLHEQQAEKKAKNSRPKYKIRFKWY
jgi:hypothetical protein